MSSVNTHHSAPLSAQALERFAREVAKYPDDQKQSAVMACLSIAQQEQGYVCAESERVIADLLGMAPMAVHEVTTFYNMYNQQPVGKFKINVCTNLPCQLRNTSAGSACSHRSSIVRGKPPSPDCSDGA
jgi:NADH-quinone oxidoreductase subunit E